MSPREVDELSGDERAALDRYMRRWLREQKRQAEKARRRR